MPELPEVETIRRGLEPLLSGARLEDVEVRNAKLRRPLSVPALRRLRGRRVLEVRRRAKYLLVRLDHGGHIILHLGMSGQLLLLPEAAPLDAHDHVRWWLEAPALPGGRGELRFRDPRRFGLIATTRARPVDRHPLLARLGPEPLDVGFTASYLYRRSAASRRPIKNLLMDAGTVAGVGNIYANEALWLAAVNPRTSARRISRRRAGRIRDAVREVLESAIAAGGTTINDFRAATGQPGYFSIRLRVYAREGEPCSRCGRPIRRIVLGGRSTFYCTGCQH